uniref:Uncharacterized protein n=1 Tax=Opuntia streptacantha TaxID=393608 RepID=A0A7C9AYI9_OPUST
MDIKLLFAADNPPLSVIAAAKVAGVPLSFDPSLPSGSAPLFVFSNGMKLHGAYVLLRYVGRIASHSNFYGKDPLESGQIDEWLEYLPIFDKGSEFEAGCSYLDSYLLTNTFLVGHEVSIADICLLSALAGSDLNTQYILSAVHK